MQITNIRESKTPVFDLINLKLFFVLLCQIVDKIFVRYNYIYLIIKLTVPLLHLM